ncbi:MAG: phosphocholine cytidylyltransferase family protein [Promethearchaeota archaeon]
MQAIILAAGRGVRLSPITDKIPKCLVEINGIPFLINTLDALSTHKEINEVIIVIGYKKEMIKSLIGNSYKGLKIKYVENDIWDKTNNIYSLWMASDLIKEDLILLEGDVFFEHKILDPIFNEKEKNIVLVATYESFMLRFRD